MRLWSGLSPSSRRLLAAGIGLLLLMILAISIAVWRMRADAQAQAYAHLDKLGIAVAEQTSRSIEAVDVELEEIRADVMQRRITTQEAFRQAWQSRDWQVELRQRRDLLPQADAFVIVDSDGSVVSSSRSWPTPQINVSDRDYFRYLRDTPEISTYVTRPMLNRANGAWSIYLARRVSAPDGTFLGLVVAGMNLNYFESFYRVLTEGADTNVALITRSGTVLASFPRQSAGQTMADGSPWYSIVAGNTQGSFVTNEADWRARRIASVHPLKSYPLVIDVSASVWDFLRGWLKILLIVGAGTAAAAICVLLLVRALLLQFHRLEESEASLVQQNARLQTMSRALNTQSAALQSSQQRLAENSTALETALAHMNQGIMMVDATGQVVVCNRRAMQMLDLPETLMNSRPSFEAVVQYQHSIGEFWGVEDAGTGIILDRPFVSERKRPNGRSLEIQSMPLPNGGMVRTYTDITERRIAEERVRYFAHHDDLTKLLNRVVFHERLNDAIDLAVRTERSIAVLYLDLDRFKLVNDTKGHGAGDKLLVQVATRLRETVRDVDTVARMGGDEFAIIQPLIEQSQSSVRLAGRILEQLKKPFLIDDTLCTISASIGIALYPDHAANASDLLRNADTALYRAKSDGRGIYCVFEESMDAHQQAQFVLEQELRLALELGQFHLDYQPIVDTMTGRIMSCEALLRWRHPMRGVIPPGEFIALAENSGLIIPIGLWALETACAEAVHWPADVQIAVNLSPAQFNHAELADQLTDILDRTGLGPDRLVLEVTEGLLLEGSSMVLGIMSHLRALGVQFTLDDFGTAHAGLSYLRQFPFDVIKIDKSFVQDMLREPGVRVIVASVLEIGAALELGVIAEGVETPEQLAALQKMHCHQVQGFLTGHPASAAHTRQRLLVDRPVQDNVL